MALDIPNSKEIFRQRDVRETSTGAIDQVNFNATDFSVVTGVVNLKNKTSYWSTPGQAFESIDRSDVFDGSTGGAIVMTGAASIITQVNLPHGAIITAAEVFGDAGASGEAWTLARTPLATGGAATLGTANVNTEDTSISNATVDNSTYNYFIYVLALDTNDTIYGARITYTTDYD